MGGNLFNGTKRESIRISHRKLINFLSQGYNLVRTYYYTGIPHKKVWDKSKETKKEFETKLNNQLGFLEGLQFKHNFHVTTKPLVLVNGKRQEKGI